MRIPKYIDEALRKRANVAFKFMDYDCIVSDFIETPIPVLTSCSAGLFPDDAALQSLF